MFATKSSYRQLSRFLLCRVGNLMLELPQPIAPASDTNRCKPTDKSEAPVEHTWT